MELEFKDNKATLTAPASGRFCVRLGFAKEPGHAAECLEQWVALPGGSPGLATVRQLFRSPAFVELSAPPGAAVTLRMSGDVSAAEWAEIPAAEGGGATSLVTQGGAPVRLQISVAGAVDFGASGAFSKDVPFCVKNDGEEAVTLEVNLWGMAPGEYVATKFEPGWNPELVREVKRPGGECSLVWGY